MIITTYCETTYLADDITGQITHIQGHVRVAIVLDGQWHGFECRLNQTPRFQHILTLPSFREAAKWIEQEP